MKRILASIVLVATLGLVTGPANAADGRHKAGHHGRPSLAATRLNAGSRLHIRFATEPASRPHPGHLAALVGDRASGLGFYALPARYRVSQGRDERGRAYGDRRTDAIRYAVASEVGSSYYYGIGTGDEVYGDRHHHALFNPIDGYGTPFFAGYYGPAGDPNEERGPFGQPYTN